ncbi:pilus assembly protein [Lentisalinibacter sediminis]|uniref:pilus assembly protein n=1 Tax=Lentisalinibacter sediminis TaxID=2992237 RepID=UPI0038703377
MTRNTHNIRALAAGALLSLAAGGGALADDTELLVLNPTTLPEDRPNILFIMDSSGSMQTQELVQEDYDPDRDYSGSCDNSKLYWTTNTSATPDCSVSLAQIDKDSFFCDRATAELRATGAYTDKFVQYREYPDEDDTDQWARLDPSDNSSPVECARDSGLHGETDSSTAVFAQRGLDNLPWTSDPDQSLVWGADLADTTYKVVDGNYMNWAANPPTVFKRRTDILKEVAKNVLGSVNDVNVGMMRFNFDDGGQVIKAMERIEDSRAELFNAIDNLPASGVTPLAETMWEAARYYRGMSPEYHYWNWRTDQDLAAVDTSTSPDTYVSPVSYSCSRNFIVLLTDGLPVSDWDVQNYNLTSWLPDYSVVTGRNGCTGSGGGACLDDIAEYLFKGDLNGDELGTPHVNTYTIGFRTDFPLLKETAEVGGGQYYTADNTQGLTDALTQILNTISQQEVTFTAPAVPVNAFNRAQNLNELYVTVFRADRKLRWPGNLKKYKLVGGKIVDANGIEAVDPATGFFKQADPNTGQTETARSFWSDVDDGRVVQLGGAANELPSPSSRNLYTNLTGNSGVDLTAPANAVSLANAGNFALSDLGLTGASTEPSKSDLIAWALGEDIQDEDGDPLTTQRDQMGDPLHSRPAVVVYGTTEANVRSVVFVGTNEGYVHAIDAEDGSELWAFLPREKLSDLARLFENPKSANKHYGVDGNMQAVIIDKNNNGLIDTGIDNVYLVFGMRRGGGSYYAIDITDPEAPELAWKFSNPTIGQSWSTPVAARVAVDGANQADHKTVLIFAGGYDVAHDEPGAFSSTEDSFGNAIFMVDVDDGELLWSAGNDSSHDLVLPKMKRAIPSDVTVADMNGNGRADRMYVGDMGGQLWRFDIFDGQPPSDLVAGGVIGTFGIESGLTGAANERRFFVAPDIAIFRDPVQDKRYLSISIGTGYRSHPLDTDTDERFYSIRDPYIFQQQPQAWYDGLGAGQIVTEATLVDVTNEPSGTVLDPSDDGWMLTLRDGEKILSESRTFNDTVFVVSFQPKIADLAACNPGGGTNRLYEISVVNGDPPPPEDGEISDPDPRSEELKQEGIAPETVFLFPSPDDPQNCVGKECSPDPVGCVGVECFDPGFENVPVRTFWTEDGVE